MAMTTESKKTLLLRISGEVDPSLGKAVKEQEKFIDGLSKVTKDSQEEQLKDLESFVKKLAGLKAGAKEAWEQYVKSAGLAEKRTGKVSNALKTLSNVLRGAWQGLKRVGEMLLALVIHDVILAGWRRLAALVKAAAARVKDFIRTSIGLAATFDETEKGFTALLGSVEATEVFLDKVRETANRTGQSFLELAQASKSLIPYAKGSAETFQQLLDTLSLLRAFRPEMGPTGAMIAITEAMAGQMRSLQYRYNVSASLIQQLQDEGYESLELIQEALKRMGVTSAIIEAQATTWRGLFATIKGVVQEAMAALAEGPFRELITDLQTLKAWLIENRTQIILFATAIGERLANAYQRVRQVLVSVFSPEVLMDIFRWGVEFSASLARGIISGISFVLNAIRSIMSAITGREMKLPAVSRGAPKAAAVARRGGVTPSIPAATVPPTATQEAVETQEEFNRALADQAAAQNRVNAATAAYRLAQEKVAQLQERIRLWTIETADVPERYKRAARNMWERRLIAAQRQARLRQQELQAAQQALQVTNAQVAAAKEMAVATEQMTDMWGDWALELGDVTTETEGFGGIWADMLDYIDDAFAGIGEDLENLALQFSDIVIQWPTAVDGLRGRFEGFKLWFDNIDWILDFYIDRDGLIAGIVNLIKDIGRAAAAEWDNLPWWFKALLYMTPLGPGLQAISGFAGAGLDVTDLTMPMASQLLDATADETTREWLQGIYDTIAGFDKELGKAAKENIFDPIVDVAQEIYDKLAGKSIFPDMVDEILKLFRELPGKLLPHLQQLVTTIRVYGESAAQWWDYSILQMQYRLQAFVQDLYAAISAIQYYLSVVSQMGDVTTTGEAPAGKPGRSYQMGGYVSRLQTALLHPGEIVLNVAQQKNVAAALAMPQMGSGISPNVTVDQRNWRFAGALTEAERRQLKKMAKEASFEGIREAFTGAG